MKTKLIKLLVLSVASLGFASCGMVTGLGQDFQKVGTSVQKTAQGGFLGSKAAAFQTPAYQIPAYQAPAYALPQ